MNKHPSKAGSVISLVRKAAYQCSKFLSRNTRGLARHCLNVSRLKERAPSYLKALTPNSRLKGEFDRVDLALTEATCERNTKEQEEYDAEIVVSYCNHYLQNASELWDISLVEDQSRLQELILPGGIHYDSLEGKRTPKFSLVYEAIKDIELAGNDVAAPPGIEPGFAG